MLAKLVNRGFIDSHSPFSFQLPQIQNWCGLYCLLLSSYVLLLPLVCQSGSEFEIYSPHRKLGMKRLIFEEKITENHLNNYFSHFLFKYLILHTLKLPRSLFLHSENQKGTQNFICFLKRVLQNPGLKVFCGCQQPNQFARGIVPSRHHSCLQDVHRAVVHLQHLCPSHPEQKKVKSIDSYPWVCYKTKVWLSLNPHLGFICFQSVSFSSALLDPDVVQNVSLLYYHVTVSLGKRQSFF